MKSPSEEYPNAKKLAEMLAKAESIVPDELGTKEQMLPLLQTLRDKKMGWDNIAVWIRDNGGPNRSSSFWSSLYKKNQPSKP